MFLRSKSLSICFFFIYLELLTLVFHSNMIPFAIVFFMLILIVFTSNQMIRYSLDTQVEAFFNSYTKEASFFLTNWCYYSVLSKLFSAILSFYLSKRCMFSLVWYLNKKCSLINYLFFYTSSFINSYLSVLYWIKFMSSYTIFSTRISIFLVHESESKLYT